MYVATDAKALQASFHDVLNKLEKTKLEASLRDVRRSVSVPALAGRAAVALDALLRALLLRRFP